MDLVLSTVVLYYDCILLPLSRITDTRVTSMSTASAMETVKRILKTGIRM